MKKIFLASIMVYMVLTACGGQKSVPTVIPSATPTVVPTATATALISTSTVWLTFLPEATTIVSNEEMEIAKTVLQERLDLVLLEDAIVQVEDHNLRVGLTSEIDLPLAIRLATNVGEIVFFYSIEPVIPLGYEHVPPDVKIIATDADIANAAVKLDSSLSWWVKFSFTSEGKDKIASYSKPQHGAWLNIAQDNVVFFSMPDQQNMGEGTTSITGAWDEETAKVLAAQLKSGRLPFQLVISE